MKKFLFIILSLIIAVFCVGCASTYTPEMPGDGETSSGDVQGPDIDPDAIVFKVTLICNNKPFYPMEDMYAQWIGEDGVHNAKFNVFGVAEKTDLDGDYRVTLSNVPTGYTYDPNNHYADNDNREITIQILELITPDAFIETSSGKVPNGTGITQNSPIYISSLGTYRTTLSSNQSVWYKYKPLTAGSYSIESWVDIVANEVNPRLTRHVSNEGGYVGAGTSKDSGGSASSFTKNFRMEVSVTASEIGNAWLFKVYADVVNDVLFPVILDFTIKFEAPYDTPMEKYTDVVPNGPFATSEWWTNNPEMGTTFRYTFEDTSKRMDSTGIKLNPDDGFYHFYDEQTGFGKVIYAMLTHDNRFIETYDDRGNKLDLGFMDSRVSLKLNGKNYAEFISTYAKYCNSDGVHPVNDELKEFLQTYAIAQWLFADGDGYAEALGYFSDEDSMWLFACGYYM